MKNLVVAIVALTLMVYGAYTIFYKLTPDQQAMVTEGGQKFYQVQNYFTNLVTHFAEEFIPPRQ